MTKTVNIREAKKHLSRLVRRVQSGEEIVIARRGIPVARMVAVESDPSSGLGRDRGLFAVPDDFNLPLEPGWLAGFEG